MFSTNCSGNGSQMYDCGVCGEYADMDYAEVDNYFRD